ncbi:MAG: tetratricopeptide repeat protein [Desulfobacteraceae bacterium]
MDAYTAILTDNLFSAAGNQFTGMETLANQALTSGIGKFQQKDYEGAAVDFKRAFGLSPYSSFAYEATRYASLSYQAIGDTESAIAIYKQAVSVNQTDDRLHLELGNLLFGQDRYGEAISEYEEAVRLYDDSTNRFSLGQAYIRTGRYQDAEYQFEKIIQRGGLEARNGHYGLGQSFRAQGKYDKAVEQFDRAIAKDREFYGAFEEMGYTYADAGQLDEAKRIQTYLEDKDESAAILLGGYISKVTTPKIMLAYANSSFPYYRAPKTQLSVIDGYLANANAQKSFYLEFQFNKEMDRESVENILNWSIDRSEETTPGMRYNHGVAPDATEVDVPPLPTSVYYDPDKMTATVRFNLTQNATADGTIDPSHIVFSFFGKDADGNDMDAQYDQFMGFSKSF